jgi:hypothetical protein
MLFITSPLKNGAGVVADVCPGPAVDARAGVGAGTGTGAGTGAGAGVGASPGADAG